MGITLQWRMSVSLAAIQARTGDTISFGNTATPAGMRTGGVRRRPKPSQYSRAGDAAGAVTPYDPESIIKIHAGPGSGSILFSRIDASLSGGSGNVASLNGHIVNVTAGRFPNAANESDSGTLRA